MRQHILVCLLIACTVMIPAGTSGQALFGFETASTSACDDEWNQTYGGSGHERAYGLASTGDGYLLVGPTDSYGSGADSVMVIRTDGEGTERWNQTYGSRHTDLPAGIVHAEDGYVIAGLYSMDENSGEAWLFNIDEGGRMLWNKTYLHDPVNVSIAHHVASTTDGGYIVAGRSINQSGTQSSYMTPWLMKTNTGGDKQWTRFFTGLEDAGATGVHQVQDGGYIIVVNSWKQEPGIGWLIRTDEEGNVTWQQLLGEGSDGYIGDVQPTADGGFLASGAISDSHDEDASDLWLVKTDGTGHVEWNRRYGWSSGYWEGAEAILPVYDGYLVAGVRTHPDGENPDANGWLVKIGPQGEILWSREVGGAGDDAFKAVLQADTRRYIAAGYSSSFSRSQDMWLVSVRDPGLTLSLSGGMGITCRVENQREEPRSDVQWSLTLRGPYVLSYTLHGSVDRIPAGETTEIRMLPVGFGPVEVAVTVGTASLLDSFWMLGPIALEQ